MRKLYSNLLFLFFCSGVQLQSTVAHESTLRIQAPLINPLAHSWISWTESSVQALSTTAGLAVCAGAESILVGLGAAMTGLLPAVVLGAATYYYLLKKSYPLTATGLCLQIERKLHDFAKQVVGDELISWQSDTEIKTFAEVNFYGSLKDLKEHMRLRLKKLAEIRVYLDAAQDKVMTSSLQQSCIDFAQRLRTLEQATLNKFCLIHQLEKQQAVR